MEITEKERTKLRGVVGAANWLMSSTRPDIAVHAGFLQQRISKALVSDLIEANKLVGKIRDHAHVKITIRSIPLEKATVIVSTDASWGNGDDLRSHASYVISLADQDIQGGTPCQLSLLRWRSYKQERHTQSTLGAELMSLSQGLAEGEWVRSMFAELTQPAYTLDEDKVCRERMPMMCLIDSKPIYDHAEGDGIVVRNKREAIDMLLVRRDIRENNICLKWIETGIMLADILTKLNAPFRVLLDVIDGGKYSVHAFPTLKGGV